MTKPIPHIDWETTMKTTEANAQIAAKMTERAVAALSEALDDLRRHGQQLSKLEAMMTEANARPMPEPCRPSLPQIPHPRRLQPIPLIAAFIAGAAFVGFIVS